MEDSDAEPAESAYERFTVRFRDSDVEFEVDRDWGNLIVHAKTKGRRVGQLTAIGRAEGTLLLGEVKVEDAVAVRNSWILSLLRRKFPRLGVRSFRGCGIGTRLLVTLLDHCRERGIQEIYGSVMKEGLKDKPSLLHWYQKHGFTVHPPDDRCLPGAVSMVVWRPPVPPIAKIGD